MVLRTGRFTGPPVARARVSAYFRLGLLHSQVRVDYELVEMRHSPGRFHTPQSIRRGEQSLVVLMDYRGKSGFDKANLAIA